MGEKGNMDKFMTLLQVAEYLAISRETVYRLIKSGQLPGIRVGGNWRFRPADLKRFVCRRMRRYGLYALSPFFFRPDVFKRYEEGSQKYYVHSGPFRGLFGMRYGLHHRQCNEPLKEGEFCEVAFWTVEVKKKAIVLDPKNFRQLPDAEQRHWSSYRIMDQEIEVP